MDNITAAKAVDRELDIGFSRFFDLFLPVLGSGRCPNGEISKSRFRWASGEPVAIFVDPNQALGQLHKIL